MRLTADKTLKMYVGGKFIRSESGQVLPATSQGGRPMNVPRASRKDIRDTTATMRAAQPGWAGRTAYNRGQILYRLAEILDSRAEGLPCSAEEVAAAADRAVHFAGWTDKISALLSSVNPVAGAYINYSRIAPMGIVVAVPDPSDGLVGLVEALCAPLVMGNAVAVAVPVEQAELAVALAEALAVSDGPGGVVNLLTGDLPEILTHAGRMDDLDCVVVYGAAVDGSVVAGQQEVGARVLRRIVRFGGAGLPASPADLAKLSEVQTVWVSSQMMAGGGSAY